ERIIDHRHGGRIPDTDDADIMLRQVADCFAYMLWKKFGQTKLPDLIDRLELWCERRAPDVQMGLLQSAARRARYRHRLDNSDTCGQHLRLSYVERTKLRIKTIGSYDVTRAERTKLAKDRRRDRNRKRQAGKRAAAGALPRTTYLANSLSAARPWEAEGVSRATWYRRHRETSPSPHLLASMQGDGPVSDARVACPVSPGDGLPRSTRKHFTDRPRGGQPLTLRRGSLVTTTHGLLQGSSWAPGHTVARRTGSV